METHYSKNVNALEEARAMRIHILNGKRARSRLFHELKSKLSKLIRNQFQLILHSAHVHIQSALSKTEEAPNSRFKRE